MEAGVGAAGVGWKKTRGDVPRAFRKGLGGRGGGRSGGGGGGGGAGAAEGWDAGAQEGVQGAAGGAPPLRLQYRPGMHVHDVRHIT